MAASAPVDFRDPRRYDAVRTIYLIGGAPRVGKSVLAKKIADAGELRSISTDDLCNRFARTLSSEEKKRRFPLPGFSGTVSENVLTPESPLRIK